MRPKLPWFCTFLLMPLAIAICPFAASASVAAWQVDVLKTALESESRGQSTLLAALQFPKKLKVEKPKAALPEPHVADTTDPGHSASPNPTLPRFSNSNEGPMSAKRGQLPRPLAHFERFERGRIAPHRGIWMLPKKQASAEVTAIHAGTIVYADVIRTLGKVIIIDHGGGYLSLYGNLSKIHVKVGSAAQRGTPLGSIAASGRQAQSRLYFEIRKDGQALDPLAWLEH